MSHNIKPSYMTISHLNYSTFDDNAQINSTLIEEDIRKINKNQSNTGDTCRFNKQKKNHQSPDIRHNFDKILKQNLKFQKPKNGKKRELSPSRDYQSNYAVAIHNLITNKIPNNKDSKVSIKKNKKKLVMRKLNSNYCENKRNRKPININSILDLRKKRIKSNLTTNQKHIAKSNILVDKNKNPFRNTPCQQLNENEYGKELKYRKKSKTNIYHDLKFGNHKEIKTIRGKINKQQNYIISKKESGTEKNEKTSLTFPKICNDDKCTPKTEEHPIFYFKKKNIIITFRRNFIIFII